MADGPHPSLAPTASHTPFVEDDDELLFDDDLLAEDDDNGDTLEIVDDLRLDDAPAAFDKDALLRRDVWNGLVHCIVSNAKLWGTVDVAEVKELMAGPIAILPQGPLLLEPLWRYMIAKGTPKKAAAETLLFLHSRAPRWNVQMMLPAAMEELHDDTRAAVVEKLGARGVTTGTHVGMAPLNPAAVKKATAAKKAKKKRLGAPTVDMRPNLRLLASIAVVAVVAVAFAAMKLSEPEDVSARASAALGPVCEHARQEGLAVLCTTDAIMLATVGPVVERRAIVETALDVKIEFVDENGIPLPLRATR